MPQFIQSYLDRLNYDSIADFLSDLGVKLLLALLVIIFWLIIRRLLSGFVKKVLNSAAISKNMPQRRAKTLETLICTSLKYVIYFIVICQVLSQFGISVTSILAAAGIAGLAIGFGAQTLVKDLMTGLFILAEDQLGAGDKVELNGISGAVEHVGFRTTRVRNEAGDLHIIPNSSIGTLVNKSK
ncbi:MAG: mechanosensitive ion channel [Clostridiales bacterium]|jgi:small conductance mechanosensitive channel|nr:mechanosensitive ion channel [Clostridiales bacterium]